MKSNIDSSDFTEEEKNKVYHEIFMRQVSNVQRGDGNVDTDPRFFSIRAAKLTAAYFKNRYFVDSYIDDPN